MTAYSQLQSVWSTTTLPAGVTGTALTNGMTVQQKLDALNGWTVVSGTATQALITPSAILNAVVTADLAALTQLQTLQLTLLLSGSTVDASTGTSVRAGIRALFAGKTQTLANLTALVTPFDSPSVAWWQSIGFSTALGTADVTLAGLN